MADQSNNDSFLPAIIVGLLAVYLIPFFAILIDELVVGRMWFSRHAPEWLEESARSVYSPLIWIVKQLL